MISAICDAGEGVTVDEINKDVICSPKKPYITFKGRFAKWEKLGGRLCDWMDAYVSAPENAATVCEKAAQLLPEIERALGGLEEELGEMNLGQKMQVMKDIMNGAKLMKDNVAKIQKEAEALKTAAPEMAKALERVAEMCKDGSALEKGNKARAAGLNGKSPKECYEKTVGPVPKATGGSAEGAGCSCSCSIF